MSRLHLIDTNIYRAWVDGDHERHAGVVQRVENLGKTLIYVSVVSVAEVEYGLSRPHHLTTEDVQKIRSGLSEFGSQPITRHVADPYAKLRSWLVANHGPKNKRKRLKSLSELTDPITDRELGIQENDLWIASQAIEAEMTLVSLDRMTHIREAASATGLELHFAQW